MHNCCCFHRGVMRKLKKLKEKKGIPVPICLYCTEVLSSIDKRLPYRLRFVPFFPYEGKRTFWGSVTVFYFEQRDPTSRAHCH